MPTGKFGNTENGDDDDDHNDDDNDDNDDDDDDDDHDDNVTDTLIWVIKGGNAIISLCTLMLHFFDVCYFTGTSYSRCLKTYGKDIPQVEYFSI